MTDVKRGLAGVVVDTTSVSKVDPAAAVRAAERIPAAVCVLS